MSHQFNQDRHKNTIFPSNYHNELSSPTETTHWVHEMKRVPPHVLFQVNL